MDAFHHRRQQAAKVYDLLPPERQTRRSPIRFERKPDVSDAEFVTIYPERSPANGPVGATRKVDVGARAAAASPPVFSSPVLDGIAACLRRAEKWLQRASPRTFLGLAATLFLVVFAAASSFAGLFDRPAAGPAALSFSHVTLTPRDANGMHILVLNGIIENETGLAAPVPRIRADFVADDRVLASILVEPPTDRLGVGESRGFMARLPHPGGKTPDVRLSFMPSGASAPRV
jgi:hypothetical protein